VGGLVLTGRTRNFEIRRQKLAADKRKPDDVKEPWRAGRGADGRVAGHHLGDNLAGDPGQRLSRVKIV